MNLCQEAWAAPPADVFQVLQNSVHVWRLKGVEESAFPDWQNYLSEEEKAREAHYYFPADRKRFGKTRGLLRRLLGGYLKRSPLEIALAADENGCPRLSPPVSIQFSVSHSGNLGLIALALSPVGVDVEKIREDFPDQKIADRFFSEDEKKYLSGLSQDARRGAFFQLWTLKEAFFKARGQGLLLPLNRFRVLLGNPLQILDEEGVENLSLWRLESLPEAAPGHCSSLAFQGEDFRIDCWDAASL